MTVWERFMRFFGIAPSRGVPEQPPSLLRAEEEMNTRISEAVEAHKRATGDIVAASLNQVQRAEDVKLVINTYRERLAYQDANLRMAQGVLDLVSTRERGR